MLRKWIKNNIQMWKQNASFYIMIAGSSIMIFAALLCSIYFAIHINAIRENEPDAVQMYDRHYVLIADTKEEAFWDEVYNGAKEEGNQNNIYVENLGESLSMDYSTQDLIRVAINSSVDGIILYGNDDEETVQFINQATQKGICVTTIRQDIDDSKRQCFVGLNLYDLGNAFGKLILQMVDAGGKIPEKIYILMDDSEPESRQNIITLAIRDTLSERGGGLAISDIEIKPIDTSDPFSAEEDIRDIFLDEENMPDVIVCLNSVYTKCCYQAVVDYNQVGQVNIIGYYDSDTILEAVEKGIIFSTIKVRAEDMGRTCVQAMKEYQDTGYTNSYIPVDIELIGQKEAEELLSDEEE